MYKLFLFDFDGTLLDSDKMILVTFLELYAKYRPNYHPGNEHMLTFSGPPIRQTLLKEFPNENQQLMFDEFVKYSTINYDKYVKPFPYVIEMLNTFKKNEIKYGLITSKARAATNYALKLTSLDGLFDFVICADEVRNVKPDPEGVLLAMRHFNVLNKDEVIYIGDNMFDYQTAKNAKVTFGYVTFSPRTLDSGLKADVYIQNFKEFTEDVINGKH